MTPLLPVLLLTALAGQALAQPLRGAPPAPAQLAPAPAPALARRAEPVPAPSFVPAGFEGLSGGAWRLRFQAGAEALPGTARTGLIELGRRLALLPEGRITLLAQASGPAADVSIARRVTLARGIAVKEALASGGLAETRIDIRPLGRLAEALDVVDIQPPTPRSAAAP